MYLTNCPFHISATLDVPARATTGPSAPPLAAGRERWEAPARSRGRARGTYDESGPTELVLDDDDDETNDDEGEAVSLQSESFEDVEGDTGSNFEG